MQNYLQRKKDLNYHLSCKYYLMKRRAKKNNLELCSRKDFFDFATINKDLLLLFNNWVENNFNKKLTPSIDRIDNLKGYLLGNMRFITHSENVIKGNKERISKRTKATHMKAVQITKENEIVNFQTNLSASQFLGVRPSYLSVQIKNNKKIKGWSVKHI